MYTPIYSNINSPLELLVFKANEGLSTIGFEIYEGVMTMREFVDHFQPEASTETLNEYLKRQRDLGKERAKSLINYFETRTDTVLPSVTLFVSSLADLAEVPCKNKSVYMATLPANSDRLIIDGQNRHNLCTHLLENREGYESQTIAFKMVVSNSHDLAPVEKQIRQVFSDFHSKLKKPTPAQNLFFDSSEPVSLFLRENILKNLEIDGKSIKPYIATNKATKYQLMDLKALEKFVCIALGTTKKKLNEQLENSNSIEAREKLFQLCLPFLKQFFGMYPLTQLGELGKRAILNKAIFWDAYAWVVRSAMEDGIASNSPIDWSTFNQITELPLGDMTDPYWQEIGVVVKQSDLSNTSYKMVRGSEKRLARAICMKLRIFYSNELGH